MTRFEKALARLIPPCAPEHYKKIFLISTVISLVAILLISALIISHHSYGTLRDNVIANSEKIADSIYCTEVDSIVITTGGDGVEVTIPPDSFDTLDTRIRDMFSDFNVVNFAFYDKHDNLVYSTNKRHIGAQVDQAFVRQSIAAKKITFQHIKNQEIIDLQGETRAHIDLAKVIVPLKHDSGHVAGAFVVSSDVTQLIGTHYRKLSDTIIALAIAISIITFVSYSIVIRASTDLKTAYNQVSHLAKTDPLTGIANRRSLFDQAELLLAAEAGMPHRDTSGFGCIMLDIDHFKAVNDTHGHQAGDCLLKELATQVGSLLRPYDVFGRYGGEEFLIVLPNTKADNVQDIAHRQLEMIRAHQFEVNSESLHITVSMGATWTSRSDLETLDTIIHRADALLYQAKQSGRDKVMFSVPPASTPV